MPQDIWELVSHPGTWQFYPLRPLPPLLQAPPPKKIIYKIMLEVFCFVLFFNTCNYYKLIRATTNINLPVSFWKREVCYPQRRELSSESKGLWRCRLSWLPRPHSQGTVQGLPVHGSGVVPILSRPRINRCTGSWFSRTVSTPCVLTRAHAHNQISCSDKRLFWVQNVTDWASRSENK